MIYRSVYISLKERQYLSDEEAWTLLTAESFFEGYSEKDSVYDSLAPILHPSLKNGHTQQATGHTKTGQDRLS